MLVVGVVTGSVIGFTLAALVELGRFVAFRVTNVDLTVVEVLFVGLAVVVNLVFELTVELASDSTENVVTSISSADKVVGSTFTMKSVGVGLGRGAFVVST